MTPALQIAAERRLDWLLAEVLGPGPAVRAAPARLSWLAAAIALLAMGAAFGVAWLREDRATDAPVPAPAQPQAQDSGWHECHGAAALDRVPADVTALRCFDFDDVACGLLAKFTKLERLDLSGMDVNEQGYAVSLSITDAGVRALAPLTKLRWLSLAQCHAMKGEGLQVLEAMPHLEHLDLTYSGVGSPAIERLPRLPGLRTLVLSHCMNFHGRSLAGVASIPGLRRLELRGCPTISTADALNLVLLTELRYLDLRDCQGRFRGQVMSIDDITGSDAGEEPPPPPKQDGIGINDSVIAAISARPLETLLLGGCEALTDAIGENLRNMRSLRSLDLSNLPKTTGALIAKLPAGLEELWLDDNRQFPPDALRALPQLPMLRTLGIGGLHFDAASLDAALAGKPLRRLGLGGVAVRGKGGTQVVAAPPPATTAARIAAIATLEELDLRDATFVDRAFLAAIAKLPALRTLDLQGPASKPLLDRNDAVLGLAENRTIRELKLVWNRLTPDALRALAKLPLTGLDLYGCNLARSDIVAAAAAWPGCSIRMPNGQRFRAP